MIVRRTVAVAAIVLLNACTSVCMAAKPNVLIILADDQGWGDLSCHGNANLSTPHIDSLARDGASFSRFFVCPVCSPTRAEFLTGRYFARSGVRGVSRGGERMHADEVTIAQLFADAGYETAIFGKWHNGTQHPYHPNARGFDEFYGFASGHWGNYYNPLLEHNGEITRGKGYLTNDLTDHAIKFLANDSDKPKFVFLALNIPHSPMQVPDEWYGKFKDVDLQQRGTVANREKIEHTRAALAMCENIDSNVGRLLAHLKESGTEEETIVVYFSDNGPNGNRWNAGMRGIKGSTDEGGVRSPLFVRWTKQIAGETSIDRIAGAIDLLPTLCSLCDVPIRSRGPLDGRNLVPLLKGDTDSWTDRTLFSCWGNRLSARTQEYRLDNSGKLYNMVADPAQTKNIAGQEPRVAASLKQLVEEFRRDIIEPNRLPDLPFDVGYAGSPSTWLPARDGIGHGGIRRSSRHPNCSYFWNWKTTDDFVSWDVHVHQTGDYKVKLLYACPEENVGCRMELASGSSSVLQTIDKSHNPSAYGAAEDRSPRTESLVKDFRTVEFDTIRLTEGDQQLALKALEIPGEGAIEVRLLVLTRQP